MKKLLFLLTFLLLLIAGQTKAGNLLGAQINYGCVAPGVYTVTFTYVQDCSTVTPPPTVNLNLSSPGCNPAGRTLVLNKIGGYRLVTQTCAGGLTPNCSPDNQPGNAFSVSYTTTLIFTSAEQACSEWVLGVNVPADSRTASANLAGTSPQYLEAMISLKSGRNNNSVEFSPLDHPYAIVIHNQNSLYPLNGTDVDGDSLVYSFRPALQASASPATYQAPYTYQSPIASNPAATLSNFGQFEFTPNLFTPNTSPTQGQNRYVVVFRIDEYRKFNGVMELVGYTQREITFDVRQPNQTINHSPTLGNFAANGQSYVPNGPLVLTAGQPLTVTFDALDLDQADQVKIEIDSAFFSYYGLARFKILNNFARPQVEIKFTPTSSHVSSQLYYLAVKLEDNSCPVKAITTDVLMFEVRSPLGIKNELKLAQDFNVYPNPFSQEVTFSFRPESKPQTIIIYNLLGQEVDRILLKNNAAAAGKTLWLKAQKQPAGTYIAKLISEDKTVQTLKLTKLQ